MKGLALAGRKPSLSAVVGVRLESQCLDVGSVSLVSKETMLSACEGRFFCSSLSEILGMSLPPHRSCTL